MSKDNLLKNIYSQYKQGQSQLSSRFDHHVHWFFYWKTSPDLWENEISKTRGEIVFIPINWSEHCFQDVQGDHFYDFGTIKDELNLKTIEELCSKYAKRPMFFVPLSPYPFAKNGGVPGKFFKGASDPYSLSQLVRDSDGIVHEMPSFFEQNVFINLKEFLFALKDYMEFSQMNSKVKGLESGVCDSSGFVSNFEDRSKYFMQRFEKYIQVNEVESVSPFEAQNFSDMVKALYHSVAHDCLQDFWDGEIRVSFFGGQSDSVYYRTTTADFDIQENWKSLETCMQEGVLPSVELVSNNSLPTNFKKAITDLISYKFIKGKLNLNLYDSYDTEFKQLVLCEVFEPHAQLMEQIELKKFIDEGLSGHIMQNDHQFFFDYEDDIDTYKVSVIFARSVSESELYNALRFFKVGGKVLFDLSQIPIELKKKFDIFLLENDIPAQSIDLIGPVTYYSHGNGQLICFESSHFTDANSKKKQYFWNNIFKFFEISTINVQASEDVSFFILARYTSAHELNYDQVRRVYLYNKTNNEQKVFIPNVSNVAFLKFTSPEAVQVTSTTSGVEIILGGHGNVKLDFGVYREI